MKILFFSDPHLGVDRRANTTVSSRKRLKERIAKAVGSICDMATQTNSSLVCLGDFFDTYSNSEEDLLTAFPLFQRLDLCLPGNHDVANDKTKRGSFDMLSEVCQRDEVQAPRIEVDGEGFHITSLGAGADARVWSVPHHANQSRFENTLQNVYEGGAKDSPTQPKILLLHCNYNLPEALSTDTALNLTEEDAEILLEVFDYVLLGHEHTPAEYFGGRLKVVGSLFPTSFADISDKRVLSFDTDTGEMESHQVWSAAEGYKEIPAATLFNLEVVVPPTCQFIRVVGKVDMGDVRALGQAMQSKLWKAYDGQLLAVKDATTVLRSDKTLMLEGEGAESMSLPDLLERELEGTPMYGLWREVYESHLEKNNA